MISISHLNRQSRVATIVDVPEIDVRDETLTATYHLKYRAALPEEVGKRFVVYLQSGFDPGLRPAVAAKLEVTLPEIDFLNEQSDTLDFTRDGKPRVKPSINPDHKVKRAKALVTQYLPSLGLDTVQAEQGEITLLAKLTALIDQQKVVFLSKTEWALAAKGPGGSPEGTEGITTPAPRGDRLISINGENHTLNAIIHELFHAIESDSLGSLDNGVVEGMTEYFALQASGLDARLAQDGGTVYRDNVRVLRLALAKGATIHEQLVQGYFLGRTDLLNRLIGGWKVYSAENEKIAFVYTGQSPTPQQIAALWKAVEDSFS
jgi:hypothetical protein